MSRREESAEDLAETSELEVKKNGMTNKCGEYEFNVSFKSTQGHKLLPAEGKVEEGVPGTCPLFRLQPAFTEAEIDNVAKRHREEYYTVKHQGEEPEEEGKAKKIKVKDALIQLENLPRRDGEWIRGEIRQLGQVEETKQVQKVKRKHTVENGPMVKIREAFEKRLNLKENE